MRSDNLQRAYVQHPNSFQIQPLRRFKQVMWGDIWQLPQLREIPQVGQTGRQDRQDYSTYLPHGHHDHHDCHCHGHHDHHGHQDRQKWHLNLTFQLTCVGQLLQFLQCFISLRGSYAYIHLSFASHKWIAATSSYVNYNWLNNKSGLDLVTSLQTMNNSNSKI